MISEVSKNIDFTICKIEALINERKSGRNLLVNKVISKNLSKEDSSLVLDQAYSDALINMFGSLVDYYYLFVVLKIGVEDEYLNRAQFKSYDNFYIKESSSFKGIKNIDDYKEKLNKKYFKNISLKEINCNYYWVLFFKDAIVKNIKIYNQQLVDKDINTASDEDYFGIDEKIINFYFLTKDFYCNKFHVYGISARIYLDLNNYLKHNYIPYQNHEILDFPSEKRFFSYFEIYKKNSSLMREGLLKKILDYSFDDLCKDLMTTAIEKSKITKFEVEVNLGKILSTCPENGYKSNDGKSLYFSIFGVFFVKKRESILIDSYNGFYDVISRTIRKIENGKNLIIDKSI